MINTFSGTDLEPYSCCECLRRGLRTLNDGQCLKWQPTQPSQHEATKVLLQRQEAGGQRVCTGSYSEAQEGAAGVKATHATTRPRAKS